MDYFLLVVIIVAAISQVKILSLSRANKLKSVMIVEMQIEDQLSDILRATPVDRAILMKVHNGGKEITIGSQKKISVIVEPEGSLSPHMREVYNSYPLDRTYKQVLIDLLENKDTFIYHSIDALPFGMLRRRSEADLVTGTMHYYIKATRTGAYFVLLGTTGDPNELLGRPASHSVIEEKIQAIRALCNAAARKKLLK